MHTPVETVIRRERQLHALSYVVIIALCGMAAVLTSAILKGLGVGNVWLIESYYFRVLFPGLLVATVLYMADQHRRLQNRLREAHEALATTATDLERSVSRLTFAYDVAQAMASLTVSNAINKTLAKALEHFDADVAAIVEDDVDLVPGDEAAPESAVAAIMSAAVEAVRSGRSVTAGDRHTGFTLAVPLRVTGRLTSVAALWRKEPAFSSDDVDTLLIASRLLELGLENRVLLEQANGRLRGLMNTVATLVADRVPEYRQHAQSTADLAVNVGLALGLTREDIDHLREAATLLDVGMLDVPAEVIAAPRPLTPAESEMIRAHPVAGERILAEAGFHPQVISAVRAHHERLDGSGYPDRARGDEIPLLARILGVCDTFVALSSPRPHRPAHSLPAALTLIEAEAGSRFDARVVAALKQVLGMRPAAGQDVPEIEELLRAAQ
ncbi:MAG: HD domain-containing protein [Coriobacteriia bacterium]|nr:HD domain-containing protein [Coriobacteriia bacterium]